MDTWKPQPHLRQKREVDLNLSDKEIFEGMSLGDIWGDAKLIDAYKYIRAYKPSTVPDSWQTVLDQLDKDLDAALATENNPKWSKTQKK